jgi:hypothetical protein
MQLQEYSQRQQQLELKYRPVVQQLPSLQQQLRPDELSAAAEFALTEGMRQPIMQVGGWECSLQAAALYTCSATTAGVFCVAHSLCSPPAMIMSKN